VERGGSPRACILREVREETSYILTDVIFRGLLTWDGFETQPGGLYIFTAEAPEGEPQECAEGCLEWKRRDWVFSSPEVVSNIPIFGPLVLGEAGGSISSREVVPPQHFHFSYQDGRIIRYEILPLTNGWNVE
jgi:8-oxo-dGTP diphosphatase